MSGNSETVTLNDIDVEKKLPAPAQESIKQELDESQDLSPRDPFLVQLEPSENPCLLPLWRKWLAVAAISSSSLCATFASSVVRVVIYFGYHGLLTIGKRR